jgi:hypothetical protein
VVGLRRNNINWFKHDTDASTDARIKKLILRYGTDGYAIYFHCLELIAGDLNDSNITFELEHDSEIIADNLKIKGTQTVSAVDRVNEIMRFIIELELFECKNEHIFCFKLLNRLDSSMTSNSRLRKIIVGAKEHHDKVMIKSCKNRIEKTRIDKNRIDHGEAKIEVIDGIRITNFTDEELSIPEKGLP